jgi:hypothetical protein
LISTSACRSGRRSWCCRRARSNFAAALSKPSPVCVVRISPNFLQRRAGNFKHTRFIACAVEPSSRAARNAKARLRLFKHLKNELRNRMRNRKGRQMRSRISLISIAILLAGTLTAAAQQRLPQEPRGEDSSRSSTPSGQQPGPDEPDATVGRGRATVPGTTGPGGQSTPQEPRGEDSSRSSRPSNQQLPPNPNERR